MLAIYKKEMKTYFHSMIGYLFLGFFLAMIGLYHFVQNMYAGYASFSYALYGVRYFLILLIPMITMRMMAEENHAKTDQLLFTSPVSITKIILGKYLSVLSMFAIVMAVTCLYPLVMTKYGSVNLKSDYATILAFFLMGAAYLAIGMFISTVTESQAFAAIITFVVVLLTTLASGIGSFFPTDNKTAYYVFMAVALILAIITYVVIHNATFSLLAAVLLEGTLTAFYFLRPSVFDGSVVKFFDWMTVSTRMDNFISGIFDVSALVYYLSLIILFVFLSIQAIKKRRWS